MNFQASATIIAPIALEIVAIFSAAWFLSKHVQRIFKFGDMQNTSVMWDVFLCRIPET